MPPRHGVQVFSASALAMASPPNRRTITAGGSLQASDTLRAIRGQDGPEHRPSHPRACPAGRYSSAEPGTARSAAWKPTFEWVPSQNGFVVDAPQRHSATVSLAG